MLSYKDLSTLQNYCDALTDTEIRIILDQLIREYCQYKKSGSPKDCARRKEWMEMSYEDILNNFNGIIQGSQNEVLRLRKNLRITQNRRKEEKEAL